MNRTTISLPPELHKRLRAIAAERGISMAALIREALEVQCERPSGVRDLTALAGVGASGHSTTARDSADMKPSKFRSLGIGDSGYTDTSVRAGKERPVPRS